MPRDILGLIAFLAGCCVLCGVGAWTGRDREAGRMLMVIGVIVLVLAVALFFSAGRH